MSKVLVIRKTDKTIHQVPIENKARLMAYSNRLPVGQKWSFEVMDEKDAKDLPFFDKDFVTGGEAVLKLKSLEESAATKDAKIAELEAMLSALNGGAAKTVETALEVIAKINAATTPEDVKAILGADDRKTVLDAAAKKIGSL